MKPTANRLRLGKKFPPPPPVFDFEAPPCEKHPFYHEEKKCRDFVRVNLRAPPSKLVFIWGRQLKLEPATINEISDRSPLRHSLGASNPPPPFPPSSIQIIICRSRQWTDVKFSTNWKKTTPPSFRSPYVTQGDLGVRLECKLWVFFFTAW